MMIEQCFVYFHARTHQIQLRIIFQPMIMYIAVWCLCMAAGVHSQTAADDCVNCGFKCLNLANQLEKPCVDTCETKLYEDYPSHGVYYLPDCPIDLKRPEYGGAVHCSFKREPEYPECDPKYPCTAWATNDEYQAAYDDFQARYLNCHTSDCDRSNDPAVLACTAACSVPCAAAKVQAEVSNGGGSETELDSGGDNGDGDDKPSQSEDDKQSSSADNDDSPALLQSDGTPYQRPSPSPPSYQSPPPPPSGDMSHLTYQSDDDDESFYQLNPWARPPPPPPGRPPPPPSSDDDWMMIGTDASEMPMVYIYIAIFGSLFLICCIGICVCVKRKNQRRQPPVHNGNQGYGYANQGYGYDDGYGYSAKANPFYEFGEASYHGSQHPVTQPPARKKTKNAPVKMKAATKKKASTKKASPAKKKGSTKTTPAMSAAKVTVSLTTPFGIGLWGDDTTGIKVGTLKEGRAADKTGKIKVGMKIISINGNSTKGLVKEEVSQLIRDCKGVGEVPVVFQATKKRPSVKKGSK